MANVWTPPGPNQNLFDPNADPFNQGGTVSGIPLPGQNPGQNPNSPSPGTTSQSPFTTVDPNWKPPATTGGVAGVTQPNPTQNATTGAVASNQDPMQALSSLLASYPDNPQQAIDIFNQRFPNNPLAPQYYPDKGVIGVAGQALPYLTKPGTTSGQTTWNFGGVPGGDSGPANADPNAAVQNAPFLKAYQDALLKQLGNLTDPTQNGVNDPNLKPALDANHLATQRGLENTNTGLAEQAYAGGTLHDGSFSTAKQKAAEDASANEANFTGSAVLDNQKLRQQALMNLLGVGNSQTGLALSQQQGGDQLGYNYAALMAYLNGQTVNTITGGA